MVAVLVASVLAIGGYRVHGPSMEPAVFDGDLVLANPLTRSPARFDAVVYLPPGGNAAVKRVVAVPGDQVRISGARVEVQVAGVGPWLRVTAPGLHAWNGAENCCLPDGRSAPAPAAAVVPAGSYFLLGDNRSASVDSRRHGFVTSDQLRGTVVWGAAPVAFQLVAG